MAALALVDLILLCAQLGPGPGLRSAAHDPGKFFFHLVLLPIAIWCLVACYPQSSVRKLWKDATKRTAWIAITALCVSTATVFSVADVWAGFEERLPWPSCVSTRSASPKEGLTAPRYLEEEHQRLRTEVAAGAKQPEKAVDEYRAVVESMLPSRSFLADSSLRAKVAGLLTVLGGIFAAALISTIAALVIARDFDREAAHALVIVVMLASFWLILRAYSEWYGNFGVLDWTNYPPFVIVLLAVGIGAFFLWRMRDWKNPTVVVTATLGAGAAIAAGIGEFKPEWFQALALSISQMSWPSLFTIYVLLFLFFSGLAYSLVVPVAPAPSPPLPGSAVRVRAGPER